jgi:hypothetical protein
LERFAKVIAVKGKERACGDKMETKRWAIVMEIGVAISSIPRMFMLLTRARTNIGIGVSGR